jgi:N-acyl-phosphatidylethanolamine-hydrolysing phospholipase D
LLRDVRPVLLALAAAACAPPTFVEPPPVPTDVSLLYAEHQRDGRFFNPWSPLPPRTLVRVVANDGSALSDVEASASITWVGHATFAVQDEADVFLTDPHFGEHALLPRRQVPPGIPIEAVPAEAFAVISHNHYDHLDAWTVDHLPATLSWFVPLGLADWFRERGRTNVVELDWWESSRRGRWTITCLPSQHWSRRFAQGRNRVLWCSWLLDSGERRYYFAGDTGYFHGFAEYGRRFGPIDVSMLPIGAYEPRWFMHDQHMSPEEAYRAFRDLGARWMLPMHWGTFDLTDEPADLPPVELERAVERARGDPARVRVLAIGERWHLPDRETD